MKRLRTTCLCFAAIAPILACPGRVTAAQLEARSVHRPADGGAPYVLLVYRGDPGERRPRSVRDADRGDVYFFVVGGRVSESSPGREYSAVARCREPLPCRILVDLEDETRTFTVDWAGVPEESALVDRWRTAARAHFRSLESAGRVTAFARFGFSRLDAEATSPPRDNLLRAQNRRVRRPEALELTTGAVAIEESLQLERLRGTGRNRSLVADIPLGSVEGVTIKEHPWETMLAGRRPEPHPIERLLPLDQYSFEASSLKTLIEFADWMDHHVSPMLHWMEQSSEDAGARERLERQLCLPATALARSIGPLIIRRVAATGGDPFLREGSDLTLIFELTSPALFFTNLEKNRIAARAKHPGCREVERQYMGHRIAGLVSPRRAISSYSALVGDCALVSNSLAGLERVIDARDGRIESQADGLDRRFVRTLLPRGADEAVFVFLSDPAIRRLVSPGLKLRENRRLECSASLRALVHASTWRRMRGAERAGSVEELLRDGDLSRDLLYCPDGGAYRLYEDGCSGICSIHGTLEFLTPNSELKLECITKEEKTVYERFRTTYQRYWSRFFDPIGMQLKLGEVKRLETVILPLIEMSEYRDMADLVGGEGAQKGPILEAPEDSALVVSAHLNRESRLFRELEDFGRNLLMRGAQRGILGWVGDQFRLFVGDAPEGLEADLDHGDIFRTIERYAFENQPGGVRIAVRNPLLLGVFLGAIKNMLTSAMPGMRFETLPERRGISLVRVAPGEPVGRGGPEALYYGVIGDGLYLSFHEETLHRVIDRRRQQVPAGEGGEGSAAGAGSFSGENAAAPPVPAERSRAPHPTPSQGASETNARGNWVDGSHLALGAHFDAAPRWRKILAELYEKKGAELCAESIELTELLERLGHRDARSVRAFQGALPCCPLGGAFARDADGRIRCSHGEPGVGGGHPSRRNPIRGLRHVRVTVRFTDDGMRTAVEVGEE